MKKFYANIIPALLLAIIFSVNLTGQETVVTVKVEKDGETTRIEEMHGDSLVWIAEGEHEGDQMKVMKYRVEVGDDIHEEHGGEHVVVIKSDDGETFDILIDEDCEGEDGDKKVVKKKVIKMTVESEETNSDDTNKKSKKQ